MPDIMSFPDTIEEFLEDHSFKDKQEIYTNGAKLIPVFRVKQALEHYYKKSNDIAYYNERLEVRINGKLFDSRSQVYIGERKPDSDETYDDWQSFAEAVIKEHTYVSARTTQKGNILLYGYNKTASHKNFKKGRLKHYYTEVSPDELSLNDIMDYYDLKAVIAYLKNLI